MELVIALAIFSMLVGLSISVYNETTFQTKLDTTLQKAQILADAVQRWEMEHNTRYPFDTLEPLVGVYVKHLDDDPWGNPFSIDPRRGIVYSWGADGRDDGGEGDDIVYHFDTDIDPPPGAVRLTGVSQTGSNISITWTAPSVNTDGTPIAGDLACFRIYYRTDSDADYASAACNPVSSSATTGTTITTSDIGVSDKTVYFIVKAVDFAGHESPPSNVMAVFVAKDTEPKINRFRPSGYEVPLGSPFSFYIDVSDEDVNLKRIEILNFDDGGPYDGNFYWDVGGSGAHKLTNRFHPIIEYTPSSLPTLPSTFTDVTLRAVDAKGNQTTLALSPIRFVNTPPRINVLAPGIYTISVNPAAGKQTTVEYVVEVTDTESNLQTVTATAAYAVQNVHDTDGTVDGVMHLSKTFTYSGASFSSEMWSFSFWPDVEQTVKLTVTAQDAVGEKSVKQALVQFAVDNSPPTHLQCSIDASNAFMSTHSFTMWYLATTTELRGRFFAYDAESPPVYYKVKISKVDFHTAAGWNAFNLSSNTVTNVPTNSDWVEIHTADFVIDSSKLKPGHFNETTTYYMAMQAVNSVGLVSVETATPENQQGYTQYPFKVDVTPPEVYDLKLESLGVSNGSTWIPQIFDVTWSGKDEIGGGGAPGSGIWRYLMRVEKDDGTTPTIELDWTPVESAGYRDVSVTAVHMATYTVSVYALDKAGNVSPVVQAQGRMDLTSPVWTGVCPQITNTQPGTDILRTRDSISATWYSVFQDPESNIESYEWGVATTDVLYTGVPDRVPWQSVGLLQAVTYSQNDLFVNGEYVYVVVRARNFAGLYSQPVFSPPAYVDASMELRVEAVPSAGMSPLSVAFTAIVTGGNPPYTYTFYFDGTPTYADRIYTESTSATTVTTSYTYLESEFGLGRKAAKVEVRDSSGNQNVKTIYFDLHTAPGLLVAMNNASDVRLQGIALNATSLNPFSMSGGTVLFATDLTHTIDPDNNGVVADMDVLPDGRGLAVIVLDGGPLADQCGTIELVGKDIDTIAQHQLTAYAEEPRSVTFASGGVKLLMVGKGPFLGGLNTGWCREIRLNPDLTAAGMVTYDGRSTPCYYYDGAYLYNGNMAVVLSDTYHTSPLFVERCLMQLDVSNPLSLSLVYSPVIGVYDYSSTGSPLTTCFEGCRRFAPSPDETRLLATRRTAISGRAEVVYAPTSDLLSGSGNVAPVSVDIAGGDYAMTEPVWAPDSRYCYAAQAGGSRIWRIDTDTASAVQMTCVTGTAAAVAPGAIADLCLSKGGKLMAVADQSPQRVLLYTVNGTTLDTVGSVALSTAPRLVRFLDYYSYAAPVVESVTDHQYTTNTAGDDTYIFTLWGGNLSPAVFNTTVEGVYDATFDPAVELTGASVSVLSSHYTSMQIRVIGELDSCNALKIVLSNTSVGGTTKQTTEFEFTIVR